MCHCISSVFAWVLVGLDPLTSQAKGLRRVIQHTDPKDLKMLTHPADLLRRNRQTWHPRPHVPPIYRPIPHGPLHPRRLQSPNLGLQPRRRSPVLHLLPPHLPKVRLHPASHNLGLRHSSRSSGLTDAHRSCGGTSGIFFSYSGKLPKQLPSLSTRFVNDASIGQQPRLGHPHLRARRLGPAQIQTRPLPHWRPLHPNRLDRRNLPHLRHHPLHVPCRRAQPHP